MPPHQCHPTSARPAHPPKQLPAHTVAHAPKQPLAHTVAHAAGLAARQPLAAALHFLPLHLCRHLCRQPRLKVLCSAKFGRWLTASDG